MGGDTYFPSQGNELVLEILRAAQTRACFFFSLTFLSHQASSHNRELVLTIENLFSQSRTCSHNTMRTGDGLRSMLLCSCCYATASLQCPVRELFLEEARARNRLPRPRSTAGAAVVVVGGSGGGSISSRICISISSRRRRRRGRKLVVAYY